MQTAGPANPDAKPLQAFTSSGAGTDVREYHGLLVQLDTPKSRDGASSRQVFSANSGPTNVPERVLRAIDNATIDHRGDSIAALAKECLNGLQTIFQCGGPVIAYSSSRPGPGKPRW